MTLTPATEKPRPGPESSATAAPRAATNPAHGLLQIPVLRFAVRRLVQMIPVLIGITLLTFTLLNVLPGSSARAILGEGATDEAVAAMEHRLGLDRPFLIRYIDWLHRAAVGDFGKSLASGVGANTLIKERIPVTLELIVLALILSLVFAIPVAVLAARKPGGFADRISMAASMVGLSIPGFVFGLLLILVFAVTLHALPAIGYVPLGESVSGNLRSMIMPATTIAFTLFCQYVRVLRADIVDQMLTGDYVVTARAKGVSELGILTRHALRNSLLGTVTLVGLNLGTLIGGTVITEQIFALPGIGQQLLNAIVLKDVVVVEAIVSILAITVVVANFFTDVLYALLDPRIRYGRIDG